MLGGTGPVGDRLAALRAAELCPVDLVEPAVRAVAANLRERVSRDTGLAALEEHIDFEIARDVAWSGFNYYLGNFRSRVAVNADIGHRVSQLGVLVAHECYPGHHTEHCRKEDLLVRGAGEVEHTIFLVNTPQCLMAEGLGDLALTAAVGPGWGRWLAQVLDGIGPSFDPDLAEALEIASRPLSAVRQNAAILLHDRGSRPRRGGRLPAAVVAAGRGTGTSADALPHRPALAGLHLHLRRGREAAATLARARVTRERARWPGSSGCSTNR